MTGKYTNLDIAPQEPVNIIIEPADTVRRVNIRNDFNVNSMSWEYNAKDALLLPRVRWKPIVNGNHVEVISIPDTPDAGGYNTPPIQVPNVPSMGFPASYGGFFGSPISFIEFDTDDSEGGSNVWCAFNSILDRRGDTSWLIAPLSSSATIKFTMAGLYGLFFQGNVITSTAQDGCWGVAGASSPAPVNYAALAFGGGSLISSSGDEFLLNFGSIFEIPNTISGIGLNISLYGVYINAIGAGSPIVTTYASSLKVVKFG
jgi:hypothetical protein